LAGAVIAGVALTALGSITVAISLFEIAALFFDAVDAVRMQVRKLLGIPEPTVTDMENAMSWVRILGLLLIGGTMLIAGYSTLGA
jgi:hypothetical protein